MNAPLPASQTRPGFLYAPLMLPLGDGGTPWRVEAEDFPASIVVDDEGNDVHDGLE